jgi:hypothetical protein
MLRHQQTLAADFLGESSPTHRSHSIQRTAEDRDGLSPRRARSDGPARRFPWPVRTRCGWIARPRPCRAGGRYPVPDPKDGACPRRPRNGVGQLQYAVHEQHGRVDSGSGAGAPGIRDRSWAMMLAPMPGPAGLVQGPCPVGTPNKPSDGFAPQARGSPPAPLGRHKTPRPEIRTAPPGPRPGPIRPVPHGTAPASPVRWTWNPGKEREELGNSRIPDKILLKCLQVKGCRASWI